MKTINSDGLTEDIYDNIVSDYRYYFSKDIEDKFIKHLNDTEDYVRFMGAVYNPAELLYKIDKDEYEEMLEKFTEDNFFKFEGLTFHNDDYESINKDVEKFRLALPSQPTL